MHPSESLVFTGSKERLETEKEKWACGMVWDGRHKDDKKDKNNEEIMKERKRQSRQSRTNFPAYCQSWSPPCAKDEPLSGQVEEKTVK